MKKWLKPTRQSFPLFLIILAVAYAILLVPVTLPAQVLCKMGIPCPQEITTALILLVGLPPIITLATASILSYVAASYIAHKKFNKRQNKP